jgi:CRISPR-associated endonuclease Cas1 subtype I-B
MSSDFFKFANNNRLKIGFFDEYGNYIGSFIPVCSSGNDTLIKQVVHYENQSKRLEIAKRIIMAAMHNIRSNLEYYEKKLNDETLHLSVDNIDECIVEMNEADSVESLMLIEARAREVYFGCYNIILDDDDFTFTIRTRQPPKDAINALISFGNMVLYQRIAKEIYKTCLDIRISYLHSAANGRENLNLDIAEIFKPIIIDRVIFTLINKRMINETIHFEASENNGIYLNKEGKKLFLRELGYKFYQRIQIDGEFITYESLIRAEINKLARHINTGEKYKPYKYR